MSPTTRRTYAKRSSRWGSRQPNGCFAPPACSRTATSPHESSASASAHHRSARTPTQHCKVEASDLKRAALLFHCFLTAGGVRTLRCPMPTVIWLPGTRTKLKRATIYSSHVRNGNHHTRKRKRHLSTRRFPLRSMQDVAHTYVKFRASRSSFPV